MWMLLSGRRISDCSVSVGPRDISGRWLWHVGTTGVIRQVKGSGAMLVGMGAGGNTTMLVDIGAVGSARGALLLAEVISCKD